MFAVLQRRLMEPALTLVTLEVTDHLDVSRAHIRLGWNPLRQLSNEKSKSIAVILTQGAWQHDRRKADYPGEDRHSAEHRPGTAFNQNGWPTREHGNTAV